MQTQCQYTCKKKEKFDLLLSDIQDLNEIQQCFNEHLFNQKSKVQTIKDNITYVNELSKESLNDTNIAYNNSYSYVPIVLGSIVGAAIACPLLSIPGIKLASSLACLGSGSFFGGFLGYKIQK